MTVFKNIASWLREPTPGRRLTWARAMSGKVDIVRVAPEDRLSRFQSGGSRVAARDEVTAVQKALSTPLGQPVAAGPCLHRKAHSAAVALGTRWTQIRGRRTPTDPGRGARQDGAAGMVLRAHG